MKGSRKKAAQPEQPEYDWGPGGDKLKEALREHGVDPTGKTMVQAMAEAGVFTGQVPVVERDGLMVADHPLAEEPKKFPWEEALPVEPPDDTV